MKILPFGTLFESSPHTLIMGILSKIFGEKEEKKYSIDEAAAAIQKQLDGIQSRNKSQMQDAANKIRAELKQLRQIVKEFAAKETPEFAKRSENVKDRFCTIAMKQLDTNMPEEPAALIQTSRNLLNTLGGLTQRQILHINVFFKDDFAPIGRKMKEIENLLKLDNMGGDYGRAIELHQRLGILEKKTNEPDFSCQLEDKIKELNQKLSEEERIIVTEPDASQLAKTRKDLQEIRQDIDSFLPVQKLLKKYLYAKQIKSPMLDEYINSPSLAILDDADLSIVGYVAEASTMFSELNEKKLDAILKGKLLLNEKKKELERLIEKEQKEELEYQKKGESYSRASSEKHNNISAVEQEIKDTQKQLEEAQAEKKDLNEELTKTRVEFCMIAEKLLNAEVA